MKKMIPLLAALLLLSGCTSACQGTEVVATAAPSEAVTPELHESTPPTPSVVPSGTPAVETSAPPATHSPEPSPDPTPTPTPTPTPAPSDDNRPDDETVLAAYRAAVEAFWWFKVEPLPLDRSDSKELDGQVYYRVDYPGIDSTASLRGHLKSLFSDDLVERLMPYDGKQYVDIDGVLYGQDGGRGTDITRGSETAQVLRDDNPDRCTVRVTVEVVDPEQNGAVTGSLTFDFPYEKVGEKWIFTDFSLVR